MTAEAAKRHGFATAVKGTLGWMATCTLCPWNSPPGTTEYKGDASTAAAEHNRKYHPEPPSRRSEEKT